MASAGVTFEQARARYASRRAEIVARLAEIPGLRLSLGQLKSIVATHRQAIVDEEDRTGPKLVRIAATLEDYLAAIEKLGRDVVGIDSQLAGLDAERAMRAGMGFLPLLPLIPATGVLIGLVASFIGLNLSLGYLQQKENDAQTAKVQLAQTIQDLQRRGADSSIIKALGGVYDGLGGQIQQTGETVLKVGAVAGLAFVGWKLLQHFVLQRKARPA